MYLPLFSNSSIIRDLPKLRRILQNKKVQETQLMNSIVTLKGFFLLQSCLGITTAAAQKIVSTEIDDLTSADFETTGENLAAVRQGLLDNDTKAAIDALNSSDNSLFAVILSQKGSQDNGSNDDNNYK